jgi:hypothetical protein
VSVGSTLRLRVGYTRLPAAFIPAPDQRHACGARLVRPILATFFVGYAALVVNSYTYFFAPPVISELLIALFLGVAFVKSKPA